MSRESLWARGILAFVRSFSILPISDRVSRAGGTIAGVMALTIFTAIPSACTVEGNNANCTLQVAVGIPVPATPTPTPTPDAGSNPPVVPAGEAYSCYAYGLNKDSEVVYDPDFKRKAPPYITYKTTPQEREEHTYAQWVNDGGPRRFSDKGAEFQRMVCHKGLTLPASQCPLDGGDSTGEPSGQGDGGDVGPQTIITPGELELIKQGKARFDWDGEGKLVIMPLNGNFVE